MRAWATGRRLQVGLAGSLLVGVGVLALIGYVNLASWAVRPEDGPQPMDVARDVAPAAAFAAAGLVAMYQRPASRVGFLLVLVGGTLVSWIWRFVPIPVFVTLGEWWSTAPIILLGSLVLTYPSGRVRGELAKLWLTFGLVYLVIQLARTLTTPLGVYECPDCRALVVLAYDERVRTDLSQVGAYLLLFLTATLLILLLRRWASSTPPARRVLAPVWFAGLVFTAAALTEAVITTTSVARDDFSGLPSPGFFIRTQVPEVVWETLPWVIAASLILVPLAFLWGILRSRMRQAAVSALAVELRHASEGRPLIESLRRALGDRSLELGLWSRPAGEFVTSDGQPLALPDAGSGRAATPVGGTDGPLAVMIHDPALAEQPELIDGVAAVAQLALENERLHAEVKAQLEEVRASRERIVAAADEERRRVERNIHDGAQQRLVSLSLALSMAYGKAAVSSPDVAATLATAEKELKAAISELRELARGIHPAILTEAGLGPALESLAEHSAVPVSVDIDLQQRLPAVVEATAYFVAAEALTNVAKHAAASHAWVSATVNDGWLRMRISDDGEGGAEPSGGSGLRGLLDRVAALGGRLSIEHSGSGGTHLEAEIPCP